MRLEYRKWDGRAHWHFDVDELGEDDHGLWLAARRGGPIQRGAEPPQPGPGWACLVPRTGWWIAHFYLAGDVVVYVNVTDEPRRLLGLISAIDLDLDVVGWRDGRVEVEDEEEFRLHIVRFGYPADVVAAARATSASLVEAIDTGDEPFGRAAEHWTSLARQLPAPTDRP